MGLIIICMVQARDQLSWSYADDKSALIIKIRNATDTLDDFINQCSNEERL